MERVPADVRYTRYGPTYHTVRMCQALASCLVPAVREVCSLAGADVAEMGVGTGPLSLALLPHVGRLTGYDLRAHMVETVRPRQGGR